MKCSDNSSLELGFSRQDLLKLAEWKMPYGKYKDMSLVDLPEEYLFWFKQHGFPSGELGRLMELCLGLKIEGLDLLVKPLKTRPLSKGDPEN